MCVERYYVKQILLLILKLSCKVIIFLSPHVYDSAMCKHVQMFLLVMFWYTSELNWIQSSLPHFKVNPISSHFMEIGPGILDCSPVRFIDCVLLFVLATFYDTEAKITSNSSCLELFRSCCPCLGMLPAIKHFFILVFSLISMWFFRTLQWYCLTLSHRLEWIMWSLQHPAEQMTINMRVWSASLIQNPPTMKSSHWQSVRYRGPEKAVRHGVKTILTSVLFRALVREEKNNMRSSTWASHLTVLEQTPLSEILSLLLLGTSAFLASHLHKSVPSLPTFYIKLILNFQQQKIYFNSYLWDLY